MTDLSSLVEGAASQLGRAFFLVGLLPALALVGVNQFVLLPLIGVGVLDLFPTSAEPVLGLFPPAFLTTLLIAAPLALIFLTLNQGIIRLFEGYFPGARAILALSNARFKRLHHQRYAAIAGLRGERRKMLIRYEMEGEWDDEADARIQGEIDAAHHTREKDHPVPTLPFEERHLMPTAFGNAWAVMEEYPRTRYGLDGMVFWPYIRTVVAEENPDLIAQIDGQKLLLDSAITLALVMLILFIEGIVFGFITMDVAAFLTAGTALLLYIAFYRAGVGYARSMGLYLAQTYDLYRYDLLAAFDVEEPEDLDEEYWTWTRLAAFVRRGDPFYFDQLDRAGYTNFDEDE
jgi:hypothetical protein